MFTFPLYFIKTKIFALCCPFPVAEYEDIIHILFYCLQIVMVKKYISSSKSYIMWLPYRFSCYNLIQILCDGYLIMNC